MSDPKSVLLAALDTVDSGPFEYLLYGGLAAGLWGEPRYTEDVDFVLFIPERNVHTFLRAAAKRGFAVEEDLAIQQIQISGWARLPLGAKDSPWHLDLTLGDTPFDESALQRKREAVLFDRRVSVVSPEDLIIYKLVSARDRDLLDVKEIAQRNPSLDGAYLRKWAGWWEGEGIAKIRERVEGLLPSAP